MGKRKPGASKSPPEPGGVAAAILAGVNDPSEIRAFEDARYAREMQQYCAEQFPIMLEKLTKIAQDYGLDPRDQESWFLVAFRLAMDHVPGFNPFKQSTAGRKKSWTLARQLRLLLAVERAIGERRKPYTGHDNELAACRTLLRAEPWKSRAKTPETLYRRYQEAKGDFAGTLVGMGRGDNVAEPARRLRRQLVVEMAKADEENG